MSIEPGSKNQPSKKRYAETSASRGSRTETTYRAPAGTWFVREVTLEGARLPALRPAEIEAEVGCRFDPWHDT